MKVLFLIPSLGAGGAERVLVKLANELSLCDLFSVSVKVLFAGGALENELNQKVNYSNVFSKSFRGNIHLFKLLPPNILFSNIINEHYDLIVSYLEGPTTRIVSGCTDSKTRIINWIHTSATTKKVFLKSYRNEKEFTRCMNKYHATVFVADDCRKTFTDIFPKIKLKDYVLYNPIDEKRILHNAKKETINLPKNQFNIVSVGRLMKVKGFERLIKIIKKLIDSGMDVSLNILGEGPERDNLEKLVLEYNLSKHVFLHGFKRNPYPLIQASDLYVCSSYREGYSTSVVESLILGTPVVTTDCAGMTEILGYNQEYGLIVENDIDSLYHAIYCLLNDKNKYIYYKKQAIDRGTYFSSKKTLDEIENFFKKEVDELYEY